MASKLGGQPERREVSVQDRNLSDKWSQPWPGGRLVHYWHSEHVAICGYRGPRALREGVSNPTGPDVCAVCLAMVTGYEARRRA